MSQPKQTKKHSSLLRAGLSTLLLAAAAWVLARNWRTVTGAAHVARSASIAWLGLSLLLMAVTFCIAAGIYGVLAVRPLRYRQTLLVEVSAAFVNRLLPSGLGGLGLHGVYLYKRKHTVAEATVVVSVNNLLGMMGHLLLLGCLIAVRPDVLRRFTHGGLHVSAWMAAALVAAVAVLMSIPWVRQRLTSFARNLLASVRKMRVRKLLAALGLALLLTVTYTCILASVCRSLRLHISVLQVFVVFSVGMLTSTATPTPGGLVGAEAGLFAGFVAYGVAAPTAGAAVLLYRLVTYWLPLVPGALALLLARRRRLV
jgi:uncharacterized membrane protein YbhN (UPF0104 family)